MVRKIDSNVLYAVMLLIFVAHIKFGSSLRESIPGYDLVRSTLMVALILLVAPNRSYEKWLVVLFSLLLIRFFIGDFLMRLFPPYGLINLVTTTFLGLYAIFRFVTTRQKW